MTRLLTGTFLLAGLLLGACTAGSGVARPPGGRLLVVAAENSWGSIAAQLGGDRAQVVSIITNPATDPHDYEATARDGRLVAAASYVIVNGIGYDGWARKLLDAEAKPSDAVLDVGKVVHVKTGGNPHQWYSPESVHRVVTQIAADFARLDPADAPYFAQRRDDYETTGLAQYTTLIAQIRQGYARTRVGASESIVTPLVRALGLGMQTPASFLDAVAEGNEPTAHDTATVERQIAQREIAVFVVNRQNATPDVQRLVGEARSHGIPVVAVTETLEPRGASFQAWQTAQLRALRDALAKATGR